MRRISALITTGLLLASILALPAIASGGKSDGGHDPVTICHRTNSVTNPYVVITVDDDSVDGKGGADHFGRHTGPVFEPGLKDQGIKWGDIIPPETDFGKPLPHDGLNWSGAGIAIWENGCKPVDIPVTTTTTVPETTSTTVPETTTTTVPETTSTTVPETTTTTVPETTSTTVPETTVPDERTEVGVSVAGFCVYESEEAIGRLDYTADTGAVLVINGVGTFSGESGSVQVEVNNTYTWSASVAKVNMVLVEPSSGEVYVEDCTPQTPTTTPPTTAPPTTTPPTTAPPTSLPHTGFSTDAAAIAAAITLIFGSGLIFLTRKPGFEA